MSNIKSFRRILSVSTLSKVKSRAKYINVHKSKDESRNPRKKNAKELHVSGKTFKSLDKTKTTENIKAAETTDPYVTGKDDKNKKQGKLEVKESLSETLSMRDDLPYRLPYCECKDDSELVKHIEILQRLADNYYEAHKNEGPIELSPDKPKSKPLKNANVSGSWNDNSKKHFSTMTPYYNKVRCKSKKEHNFITLEDEPLPLKDEEPYEEPIQKKSILLYKLDLQNVKDTKTSLQIKPFKPLKLKIEDALNVSNGDDKVEINSRTNETTITVVQCHPVENKLNLFPDRYKKGHGVLTRSFATNNDYKIKISPSRSGAIENQSGIFVRTLMKEHTKEELPNINNIKVKSIYKENLRDCLIANRHQNEEKSKKNKEPRFNKNEIDTRKILNELNLSNKKKENPEQITKHLTKRLIADRKANINKQADKTLIPKIYCKTSLSVRPSHLPITKCKKILKTEAASSHSLQNNCEKSLLEVKPPETQLELLKGSEEKDKSLLTKLLTFFKK